MEVTGEASMAMVAVEVLMSSDRVMTRSAKVSDSDWSQAVGGELVGSSRQGVRSIR